MSVKVTWLRLVLSANLDTERTLLTGEHGVEMSRDGDVFTIVKGQIRKKVHIGNVRDWVEEEAAADEFEMSVAPKRRGRVAKTETGTGDA